MWKTAPFASISSHSLIVLPLVRFFARWLVLFGNGLCRQLPCTQSGLFVDQDKLCIAAHYMGRKVLYCYMYYFIRSSIERLCALHASALQYFHSFLTKFFFMKRTLKLFPFLLLLAAGNTFGQNSKPAAAGQNQVANGVISGHFEMYRDMPPGDGNSVSYTVSRADDKINITLNTKYEKTFMASIRNQKGVGVMWIPKQRGAAYSETVDISSLGEGPYNVSFFMEGSASIVSYATIK